MEEPKREKPYQKPSGERRGLVLVYTGEGKGKTTAALGLVLRAVGRGFRARVFQFMKHEQAAFGEHRALERLGVAIEGLGDGFSWKSKDLEKSAALAYAGWQKARAELLSGAYFLVVWDEISYPIRYGWIPLEEVLLALKEKPREAHVVLTGRGMPKEILELADTVSEVRKVKHAFDAGVPAQRGIEH
ncbi:cob(I)yrinic acid a,c-diamide adenosyltransferase [Meiothermus sp. CFH 77666]|uniref:cob(I)yrinic acid a,c-diamide adenosyltransferase n=1 Tax=Meiothermus sp. CFH 77666 TaxID=2817942 RepID=UPI001AA012FA|nr:cob(I)yrinic acid a,c-diamide adenosyltransferase [Meiothermus sp. CFH 77666]